MESKNILKNIKSKYCLMEIVNYLQQKRLLKLIKKNKNFQNELGIGINDYKKYYEEIEIEIIPTNDKNYKKTFINIEKENQSYYHIYINDEKNECEKKYFNKDDNIKKLKIVIDKEIKSFKNLFGYKPFIEKIKFIKFNRKDINNMSYMFFYCSSLKEINLNNFNTENVTNMEGMFHQCSSLKELNLRIKSK